MKKLLFIFLLFGFHLLNAQDFNKLYTITPEAASFSDRIYVAHDGYVTYAGAIDSNNFYRVVMMRIDTMGNTIWTKTYGKRGYNYFDVSIIAGGGGGVAVPWGGYIEPGSFNDSTNTWYKSALYRFDDNGDTVWTKIYNDSTSEIGINVKITREKQYVIGGNWVNTSGACLLTLKKTDSLGNKIWQKTYHNPSGYISEGISIDTCQDDGYIISAYEGNPTNNFCGTGSIFIMKTDSAGTPQWTQYITDPICAVAPCYILSLKNGNYLVCGQYTDSSRFSGAEQFTRLFLAEISSTGSVKWTKQYGTGNWSGASELFSLKELSNGDIITCGSDTAILGCILKTDSNGNQKWLKYYAIQSPPEEDIFCDIQPISDGGFVVTGLTYGSTENIWVVKTDSLGCINGNCSLVSGIKPLPKTENEIKIYPNPSNGIFTIIFSHPADITGSQIEIYNVMGQKVNIETLKQVQGDYGINISEQPNGIYLYRIISENGSLVGEGKLVIQK